MIYFRKIISSLRKVIFHTFRQKAPNKEETAQNKEKAFSKLIVLEIFSHTKIPDTLSNLKIIVL
jgi:hypothetical protein